jgi:hypothetical protein
MCVRCSASTALLWIGWCQESHQKSRICPDASSTWSSFTDGTIQYAMTSMYIPSPVISLAVKPKQSNMFANFSKALQRFSKVCGSKSMILQVLTVSPSCAAGGSDTPRSFRGEDEGDDHQWHGGAAP